MLIKAKDLYHFSLKTKDDVIGHCKDLLFDDQHWTVRFIVVKTGNWLFNKKVIISPISIKDEFNVENKHIPVELTKQQIEDSPGIDAAKPVSRQHEIQYLKHFGWPSYWTGTSAWGVSTYPSSLYDMSAGDSDYDEITDADKHLRSAIEVGGYHLETNEGSIGHINNFLINTKTWRIRYLIIDIGGGISHKQVLLSTNWIESIDWASKEVKVNVDPQQVKNSPEYDHTSLISREYEEKLSQFYGRLIDWS